jgi:DNA polymerase III epsilon subunit family exonuclease
VIDFETTGMGAGAEVIEFACVRLQNGKQGLKLSSLCSPYGYVSRSITALTGISDEMTRPFPHFDGFLPYVLDFIGGDIIAAHNAPFDLGFLLKYCKREGYAFSPDVVCTLAGSRKLLPRLPNHRLSTVAEHFGISAKGCHRALADAVITAGVLSELLSMPD